jgi:hypothetical protein
MIRKLLAFLSFVFIFYSQIRAQGFDAGKVHIGLKIGLNFSGFTGEIAQFDRNTPGYANSVYSGYTNYFRLTCFGGVTADYPISHSFSLAGELLYNGRGAAYQVENDSVIQYDTDGNQTTTYDTYTFRMDYIEVPLLLQYKLPIHDVTTLYFVYGGLSPAIAVKTKTNDQYYFPGDSPEDVKSTSQTANLNYVSGLTVNPVVGFLIRDKEDKRVQLFGDIRFEYSISPVFNRASSGGSTLQTNMWTAMLGLGVRF